MTGGPGLGARATRDLAARHGVHPTRSLGQHFLIDPNLAEAIATESGAGAGSRVVEVGAGFGSLTRALAATGAEVLAIEFDRALLAALEESCGADPRVRIVAADAMKLDWSAELGDGVWTMCSNLPYNIATHVVLDLLERVPTIERFVVMVQREVGERLAARPGDEGYGAVSLKVAYRADARIVRHVPPTVFWPRPAVASAIVRLERLAAPRVRVPAAQLWPVIEAGFAQRRKTMRNALVRLGVEREHVARLLDGCGVAPSARAEELDLDAFARVADAVAGEMGP